MAHALTYRKNGYVEFAALGERNAVWHGLGQYITEEDAKDIGLIQKQAGMDWSIAESAVQFQTAQGCMQDNSKKVLYRDDSLDVLSVVSSEYHVVQPKEVIEFFKEFITLNQMKFSAAGTLFGGKRFWCTAEIGKDAFIVDGDKVQGFLLLMTSADGTLSTQAKFTSTRVVCNNTLQIALAESGKRIRQTHSSVFDEKKMKLDMGLIDQSWDNFIGNLKLLANTKVVDAQADAFFKKLVGCAADNAVPMNMGQQRKYDALHYFYQSGAGAEMSHGTAWGILNAVTEMETHGTGRGDKSHQFNKSELGTGASVKMQAMQDLLALV